jgi:FdhE protein
MMTATILKPVDIEWAAGEIPFLHIPERSWVFHDRAVRLRTLAQEHALKDFLLFLASLCEAQQAVLNAFSPVPLPSEARLKLCRENGMPPLSVQSWPRDPVWQEGLRKIDFLVNEEAYPFIQTDLARLRKMDGASLEALADAILQGHYDKVDLAVAPFVAAALQVYWTHMAISLGEQAFGRGDISNLCPVCASHPIASHVRIGAANQGLCYLSCSMCETQWHMGRVKCGNCETTNGISYFIVEGTSGAVKVGSRGECCTYVKIKYMNKDSHLDPVADDLATFALDLMMGVKECREAAPISF